MQHPINPTREAIALTINNPKSTKGCFETIIMLDFRASMAFKLPKIISGIVRNVKKEITALNNAPTISISTSLNISDKPVVKIVRRNVAMTSS